MRDTVAPTFYTASPTKSPCEKVICPQSVQGDPAYASFCTDFHDGAGTIDSHTVRRANRHVPLTWAVHAGSC